jgi:hypothetical protein
VTHALESIVGQLTVWCPYLFDFADFEGLTQRATQIFSIVRVDVHGFVIFLESEVQSGEVVLAGDVDEGSPFGVCEVYAFLVICCRHQVTHGLIVLWRLPASIQRASVARGAQGPVAWSHRGFWAMALVVTSAR